MDEYYEELKIKDKPLDARKIPMGIDYYYKCHWIACDADVKKYYNYCPICGQRLKYDED